MEEALLWVHGYPLLFPAVMSFKCIIRISSKNGPTHTSSSAPNVCISPGVVDDLCGYVVLWSTSS